MGNYQEIAQNTNKEESYTKQKINRGIDAFYVNSTFVLFALIFVIGTYLLMTTEAGRNILGTVASFTYIPAIMLILIFSAAPLCVLIGSKSENARDMFIINLVFLIFIMIFIMFPQVLKAPINVVLPSILAFGINFRVDQLTILILIAAAFLWLMSIIYGHNYMKLAEENRGRFYFWFLVTFGGICGALMANDLLTMFLFFEIMYLSCYFLVAHNQTPEALRAGNRYIYGNCRRPKHAVRY